MSLPIVSHDEEEEVTESSSDDVIYQGYVDRLLEDFKDWRHNHELLCPMCERKTKKILDECFAKAIRLEGDFLGSRDPVWQVSRSSLRFFLSQRALSIPSGMSRRVVVRCTHHCQETDATRFFEISFSSLSQKDETFTCGEELLPIPEMTPRMLNSNSATRSRTSSAIHLLGKNACQINREYFRGSIEHQLNIGSLTLRW